MTAGAGLSGDEKYTADWFDNPFLAHGGTYGVRGPGGLVKATSPFKAGWEQAKRLAAEMNAAAVAPTDNDLSATAAEHDGTSVGPES